MTDNAIDSGSGQAVRAALASLIDLHGPALLHEPDRLKRQLDGALPDAPRDVELILSSMREEVPHALLAAHSDEQARTLFPQLVERLVRKTGIDRATATRAVRIWAHALAVAVESRDVERPDGMRRAVDRPTDDAPRNPDAARANDAATDQQVHDDHEASRRSSAAEVLGFGTRPVRLKAPSTVRPTGPLVSPPPAAETLVAFDAFRERAVDPLVELPAAAAEAPVAAQAAPAPAAPQAPEVAAPAAVAVAWMSMPEATAPIDAALDPADFRSTPVSHEPLPLVEPIAATAAAAAAAAAVEPEPMVVQGIQIPPSVDPVAAAATATDPDEPALAFAPQRRSSSRTFALAAAIAAAVIVLGTTLWPGPHTVPAPEPKPTASATIGERPTPAQAAAAPTAVAMAPVASAPAASAPAPAPAPDAPSIARPDESLVATTLPTAAPAEGRASAPENVAPPAREAVLPVGAEVTAPAVIPLPAPAPKPSTRVVKPEPTASRPAPVAAAAPKSVKVPESRANEPRATEARKPAAPSAAPSAAPPAACTRASCGSVVSVRAIDDASTRDYEVIVRLDDRTIRAVRMPARWSTGARVRVVGGRFEPVGVR